MSNDTSDPYLAAPCGATVLRARGRRLCKIIRPGGAMVGYDAARLFDSEPAPLAGLAELHALLRDLAGRRDCALVRGAPIGSRPLRGARRLLHPDPETGEGPTLREAPRRWVALDLDSLPLPAGADPRDLAGCARAVLARLPAPFRRAACVAQATASHGIKPGARLRLWFWCDRALTGAECKRWLRAAPVDRSVFGAAQPIYTATPVFIGMADPLPRRLAILAGAEPVVAVPDPPALAPARHPGSPAAVTAVGDRYALSALSRAAARIATAPDGGRHGAALREAWGLARLVRAGLLSEGELARTIGGALRQAGKEAAEGEAIAAWAIAHRQHGALPEGARR